MILSVGNINNNVNFQKSDDKKLPYDKDTLLKNNLITRTRIGFDKFSNALTLYPAKGLKGNRNSNFYEFLTMGTVPYIIGSITLMSVFNSANKHFAPFARTKANSIGRKMALGVLFYGIMKSITKSFVTKPVKWLTGVDTEVPYAKVNYELPDNVYDTDITSIEYHKAYESKDFPRWDLFYKSEAHGENRNEYFDKVAQKIGLGNNLKDSDQEVKPLIKEIAIKTDLAKMISSYLWAAVGVAYAFQPHWEDYFNVATLKFWDKENFKHSISILKDSAIKSAKEFINGPSESKGIGKHAGKILISIAALSSIVGVINAVSSSHQPSKLDADNVIQKDSKYVVS